MVHNLLVNSKQNVFCISGYSEFTEEGSWHDCSARNTVQIWTFYTGLLLFAK